MNDEIKRELLRRKFTSIEYMEELCHYHRKSLEGLKESIAWFYNHPPEVDWQSWNIADRPDGWENRAVPNFEGAQESFEEGVEYAKQGDTTYMEDAAGSLMGIDKDLDNLGEKWWDYVDLETGRKFGVNLGKAKQIASNICRALVGAWSSPDSILNEEITGSIDELDLLRYLKPGEEA